MCNIAGIFVQGCILVMWNVCIPVVLVTLFIVVHSIEVYIDSYLISAHWHMWHLRGIFAAGTCGYSMVIKCCSFLLFLLFLLAYAVMWVYM